MKSYSEKLKDPRWQKKRLEILEKHSWSCHECGRTDKTLHVHHGKYIKDKEPWEYPSRFYHCLCDLCHADHHSALDEIKTCLAFMSITQLEEVLGFVVASVDIINRHEIKFTTPDILYGFLKMYSMSTSKNIIEKIRENEMVLTNELLNSLIEEHTKSGKEE